MPGRNERGDDRRNNDEGGPGGQRQDRSYGRGHDDASSGSYPGSEAYTREDYLHGGFAELRQPPGSGGGYGGSLGADRGTQRNRGFWPSARDEADIGRRQDSEGPASPVRRPGGNPARQYRGFGDGPGDALARRLGGRGEGIHRGRGPRGYTRSGERIREDVNEVLTHDGWVDASDIEVNVEGGEVTLSGEVAHRGERRRAEDLAGSVSGVRHVQNNIRVRNVAVTSGGGPSTAVSALADTSTGQKSSLGSDALARGPRPPRRES